MRFTMGLYCVLVLLCSVVYTKTDSPFGLSKRIGNFSVDFIDHNVASQATGSNLIISPITVWTVLAVISEGAVDNTLKEICDVIRIVPEDRVKMRENFKHIMPYLQVKTSTVELKKLNVIFVDNQVAPKKRFSNIATHYDVSFATLNFTEPKKTAIYVNNVVYNFTKGKISELINSNDLLDSHMILTSSLYFKGQWTFNFNRSLTKKRPFYDSYGNKIGEVNMMYNRHTYPFANIADLKARVIELPYGKENRLSMLIMVPYPNVTVQEMFGNLNIISLDVIFKELMRSIKEFPEDELDAQIPRFKIESNLDLTESLKSMGIKDLFDYSRANLMNIMKIPSYVSKVAHKAVIEVTEEGTTASAATAAIFTNRIGVTRFEVNRPFGYLIIEKTTQTIAFAGSYLIPELY